MLSTNDQMILGMIAESLKKPFRKIANSKASMIDQHAIQQAKRRAIWQRMLNAARGVVESRKESPYNFSEI